MSRLDDALRRRDGTGPGRPAAAAAAGDEDAFASAWPLDRPTARDDSDNPAPSDGESLVAAATFSGLSDHSAGKLVVGAEVNPFLVEQFRRLAATLHQTQSAHELRTVMITSAEPGDGKSLTAFNLALTLSESYGRRVLMLDADLRRPALHDFARVPNTAGLGNVLRAPRDHKLPVMALSERLHLVPAGPVDTNPVGALASARLRQILDDAVHRYEWVIVDAAPIGPIADTTLVAPLVDAVILVIRAGRTPYDTVQKAIDAVGRERLIGVVLNGIEESKGDAYAQYYGYGSGQL